MATHSIQTTINAETAPFVWDRITTNKQLTKQGSFPTTKVHVQLVSGGYSTDFEGTNGGFRDVSQHSAEWAGWEHGTLESGNVLNSNCNTGDECWGTNIYDFDNDYTTDKTPAYSTYSSQMITPALEVNPLSFIAKFSSWHSFHYNVSGQNSYYYDCGYVMVRNSTTPYFPSDPNILFTHIPFDNQNSTGVGFSNGLYPIEPVTEEFKVDSLSGLDYALGGESTMLPEPNRLG